LPTIQQPPIDVKWFVALASGTTYRDYPTAYAAAVALSVANSNLPVHLSIVHMQVQSLGPTGLPQVDIPASGPLQAYLVGLASQTEYYPQATGIVQAYALSTANSNAPVYLAYVVQSITAP